MPDHIADIRPKAWGVLRMSLRVRQIAANRAFSDAFGGVMPCSLLPGMAEYNHGGCRFQPLERGRDLENQAGNQFFGGSSFTR